MCQDAVLIVHCLLCGSDRRLQVWHDENTVEVSIGSIAHCMLKYVISIAQMEVEVIWLPHCKHL